MNKIMSMKDAISHYVNNGDSVYIAGFTHLIDFAAGHEIMRQMKRDLKLIRMTPDVIYDQMIAAGVANKLVFSYLGNPGVGSLRCIRRAIEHEDPKRLKIEEYTHGSLISALFAGGSNLPFIPTPSVGLTDLPPVNNNFSVVRDPFTGTNVTVVKPIKIDVTIIHAQRVDESGNAQVWGIQGEQKEAAFAARKVIVTAEEIVDREVITSDPNRTIVPSFVVSSVVPDTWGASPSYAQGFYDRDNDFYIRWDKISRDSKMVKDYLDEWVYGIENRQEYVKKLGKDKISSLKMKEKVLSGVNYGKVT